MGGVRTVQRAQGLPIAIVEEIAFENGWMSVGLYRSILVGLIFE